MEALGIPTGMNQFYIHVSVLTRTPDGWNGSKKYPTFWTVGGTPLDALTHARTIIGLHHGTSIGAATVQGFTVSTTYTDEQAGQPGSQIDV